MSKEPLSIDEIGKLLDREIQNKKGEEKKKLKKLKDKLKTLELKDKTTGYIQTRSMNILARKLKDNADVKIKEIILSGNRNYTEHPRRPHIIPLDKYVTGKFEVQHRLTEEFTITERKLTGDDIDMNEVVECLNKYIFFGKKDFSWSTLYIKKLVLEVYDINYIFEGNVRIASEKIRESIIREKGEMDTRPAVLDLKGIKDNAVLEMLSKVLGDVFFTHRTCREELQVKKRMICIGINGTKFVTDEEIIE